jgi:CheY-like chemotaxis protein
MMPNLNGYELCRRIRVRPEFNAIKIIVLTARDQSSDLEVLKASGADFVMKKPINPQELSRTVRELLEKQ